MICNGEDDSIMWRVAILHVSKHVIMSFIYYVVSEICMHINPVYCPTFQNDLKKNVLKGFLSFSGPTTSCLQEINRLMSPTVADAVTFV